MAIIIILFFITVIAAPAVARDRVERFEHSVNYRIGGFINLERSFGDPCTTGAVRNQKISGYGDMTKVEDVKISPYIMSIDEKTDWSTASDAIGKLVVATTVELCARPMSAATRNYAFSPSSVLYEDDIFHTYHDAVIDGRVSVYGLSDQIWVTEISTEPGRSGSYHADFIAAYGPGPYDKYAFGEGLTDVKYDPEKSWWFDSSKEDGIDRGKYYVGNYFNIDQYAYTSGGTLKRYISMSSPFSNTNLYDDLDVIGMAEVKESFNLQNIKRGPEGIQLTWWERLF